MAKDIYRYSFRRHVSLDDVEATLFLALVSAESLHGEAQVRLDAAHFLDRERGVCVVDASTSVGRDLNRLFVGFVRREFGVDAFTIERIDAFPTNQPEEQPA